MAVKIRLARHGAKKNPYYHIVAANAGARRDGRYLETLGKYNPLKPSLEEKIVDLKQEALERRLKQGAKPSAIVQKILAFKGLVPEVAKPVLTKKHLPKAKAQERLKAQQAAIEAAKANEATKVEATSNEVTANNEEDAKKATNDVVSDKATAVDAKENANNEPAVKE